MMMEAVAADGKGDRDVGGSLLVTHPVSCEKGGDSSGRLGGWEVDCSVGV